MSVTRTVILTSIVAFGIICTQAEAGGGKYQYPSQAGKMQAAPSQFTQAQFTQAQYTQQSQYSQPQYRQPQYRQPQYRQPQYRQPPYSGGYRMSNRASTNINIYNYGNGNYNNVHARTGMSNRVYSSRRNYYGW